MNETTYHRLVLTWLRDPDAYLAARHKLRPVLERHHHAQVLSVPLTSVQPSRRVLPDFATIVRCPGPGSFREMLGDPEFRRHHPLMERAATELAFGGTAAIGDPRLLDRARLTVEIGWPVVAFAPAPTGEHIAFSMHVSLMDDGRGSTYLPGPSAYVRVLARDDETSGTHRADPEVDLVWRLSESLAAGDDGEAVSAARGNGP